jgi:glutaconate CoA-transferase subunit A
MVRSGDAVSIEGFGQRIPFAAAHEIVRQRIGDLHLIRMGLDLVGDQLVGAGLVATLTFSWAGNPGLGTLRRFRKSVEQRTPRAVALRELSHGALLAAYRAAAAGLPFAVTRSFEQSDLPKHTPLLAPLACPFTGESLHAIRAVRPDVTILHGQRADRRGNVELAGVIGAERYAAFAAERTLVTVEELVDELEPRFGSVVLPAEVVTAVVRAPGGAAPSGVDGFYERDDEGYRAWDELSRDDLRFERWLAAT